MLNLQLQLTSFSNTLHTINYICYFKAHYLTTPKKLLHSNGYTVTQTTLTEGIWNPAFSLRALMSACINRSLTSVG